MPVESKCPFCGSEGTPLLVKNKLSTGGWIAFAALLIAAFRFAGCPSSSMGAKRRSGSARNAVSGELDTPYHPLPPWAHSFSIWHGMRRGSRMAGFPLHPEGLRLHSLPTTGGYRSFLALCRGELIQSFFYNPMMPVYLMLFCYSMAVLFQQWVLRERLVLRPLIAWMWCASLLIGWAAKFALGRQYW